MRINVESQQVEQCVPKVLRFKIKKSLPEYLSNVKLFRLTISFQNLSVEVALRYAGVDGCTKVVNDTLFLTFSL